jgi:murein DD-endopeptidase MepM/ murein hydrolase activator NlpD
LFFILNSIVTTILVIEYRRYQDLTAGLLELQSVYESYLLITKRKDSQHLLDENRQLAFVNRSAWNLKDLFNEKSTPVKKINKKINVAVVRKSVFSWPLERSSFWISSFFGLRKLGRFTRMHSGIDLAALKGTLVKAAAGGKVIKACYESGYGNTIVLEHNRKYKTRYAHLDKIFVKRGQIVSRGQKIAAVGDTGFVQSEGNNASHLHFEVYAFDKQVNPILFLPKR